MKKLTEKLNFYLIKYLLKVNKVVNKRSLFEKERWCGISEIKNNLNCKKIYIQLYKNDDKNRLFKILPLLLNYGIEIELIDFDKILSNEDIKELERINPNIAVNFRHMIDSYYTGNNVETVYDVGDYCKIISKIEYLTKMAKINFNRLRRTNNVYYYPTFRIYIFLS